MKLIILIIYLFFFSVSLGLKWLNIKHLKVKGHQVPAEFSKAIDAETLRKTISYTAETSRLSTVLSLLNNLLVIVFLFGGFITIYDGWVTSLSESFVVRGVLFVLGLMYAGTIFSIPFSL
jgi:STE24 endopeptidase